MKARLSITFLLFCFFLNAQKQTDKIIDAKEIKTISVAGDTFFKIEVKTGDVSNISLQTKIDGEYAEHMVILAEKKKDSLFVSGAFQPLFKYDNDKLSAHKVLSVELKLVIPNNLQVYIKSSIASANISGNYANLFLELTQGDCYVKHFMGNATINTINGNIDLETNYTKCEAVTKTGTINLEDITLGDNKVYLSSINGNISVTKS